jgi:hypothetical protein
MSRAYGGPAVAPGTDSKTYAKDRASMFVGAVKNNAFKSTLDDEFPSLMGNQMAYGGDLPKAVDGLNMSDYKTKDEAELAAYRYRQKLSPEEQAKFNIDETLKTWKAPEPTYEAGKNYQYDPNTKQFKAIDVNQNQGYNYGYGAVNPVAYQNPMNQGLYGNLYAGASPFARLLAGSGNYYSDPRITGANLPGGMNPNQFLGAIGGVDKLTSGMTGTVGDQTWRLGEAEKFKEGSIWKGNRRKGVRYTIDWGSAGAMNPTKSSVSSSGYNPNAAGPGYSGYNADADGDGVPDYLSANNNPAVNPMTQNSPNNSALATNTAGLVMGPNNQPLTSDGSNMSWNSGNMPTLDNPNPAVVANQSTVAPGSTDVVNTASEVNALDQNAIAGTSDGSNMMWNSGNMPTLQNPNPQTSPEQFPSLIPGSNEMVSQEAIDFQKGQAAKGLEWNGQTWGPNKQMRDVAAMINPNAPKPQDVSGVINATASGTANYADSNPRSSAPDQAVIATVDNSQANQTGAPFNPDYQQPSTYEFQSMTPEQKFQRDANNVILQAKKETEKQRRRKAYGGPITQEALENAVALINRAFGGMIPKANNGMDLGSQDTNGNGIPDYLEAENFPANQPNPFDKSGTIEESNANKLNIDWNAAGDMYMNTAAKVTNFANRMNAMNPERDMAKFSALNRPSNTYDTMKQGLYDQAGNFIPNDIGNQVLNPTDTMYNNQRQIFAYGGRVYEIGGEVDLDDNEMEQLAAAGFKFSKV